MSEDRPEAMLQIGDVKLIDTVCEPFLLVHGYVLYSRVMTTPDGGVVRAGDIGIDENFVEAMTKIIQGEQTGLYNGLGDINELL